jgi:repressor LexA
MLTRKQHELLTFIDRYIQQTGFSPSFEEMKDALDLRSKSGIHRLISALEERDFLRRRPHRARALEVLRRPEAAVIRPVAAAASPRDSVDGAPSNGFMPTVIRGDFGPRRQGARVAGPAAAVAIPFLGRIAAGQPIEAIRESASTVEVPTALLGSGEHFGLEVTGDSMIEAGIFDGDTAIICSSEAAENGQIVVALIDDNEVTLKRLRRRGNSIALEPANPRYETRIVPADRVKVQGRLIALYRRY